MAVQHDKQFKEDAVRYYLEHKELGLRGCSQNLGIGYCTLTTWLRKYRESGEINVRGSGNFASDEQKEIALLSVNCAINGCRQTLKALFTSMKVLFYCY